MASLSSLIVVSSILPYWIREWWYYEFNPGNNSSSELICWSWSLQPRWDHLEGVAPSDRGAGRACWGLRCWFVPWRIDIFQPIPCEKCLQCRITTRDVSGCRHEIILGLFWLSFFLSDQQTYLFWFYIFHLWWPCQEDDSFLLFRKTALLALNWLLDAMSSSCIWRSDGDRLSRFLAVRCPTPSVATKKTDSISLAAKQRQKSPSLLSRHAWCRAPDDYYPLPNTISWIFGNGATFSRYRSLTENHPP